MIKSLRHLKRKIKCILKSFARIRNTHLSSIIEQIIDFVIWGCLGKREYINKIG